VDNFFYKKKVLVTGASGFVGVNLINKLVALGADVRGTIFEREPPIELPEVEYLRVDLRKSEDCLRVTEGIDYVFMAAAKSSGAEVIERTPLVHLTPNLVMNALMLEAAYENHVKKFCFISSNVVYPLADFPVTENDVNNEYFEKYFIVGWMKRFSELMCQMYAEKIKIPMETLIIRPGNLYGPYDKFTLQDSKVIPALIRRAVERESPLNVWGDGSDIKDFLYIDDFIAGMLLAFQHFSAFQTINIASGIPISICEVLSSILNAANFTQAEVVFDVSRPTMIPMRLINIDKAIRELNWFPKIGIHDGIIRTVNWYKNYYAMHTPEEMR